MEESRPPLNTLIANVKSGLFIFKLTNRPYGMGLGPGVGATLQIADAQSGIGTGAGTWKSLPWFEAETEPVLELQVPVKVLISG